MHGPSQPVDLRVLNGVDHHVNSTRKMNCVKIQTKTIISGLDYPKLETQFFSKTVSTTLLRPNCSAKGVKKLNCV